MTHALPLPDRLRRAGRYFTQPWQAWVATMASVLILSLSEPLIPAMLKPLLDRGFQQGGLSVWAVPAALLLLFGARGLCAYTSQVALARVANHGLYRLRLTMFERLLDAHPQLYRQHNASALSNTLVYEVQNGANLMVNSILSATRDSLTLLALVGYLMYLNWRLCLIVALLLPAVAWMMKLLTRRLYRLTRSNQAATDDLAYVVEENALAHREIRLQGAQAEQYTRFGELGKALDRLAMKSTVASSVLTPLTQMMAATALAAVISIALLQSQHSGTTVGEFAAFVTAMLMLIGPIKHLSEIASPITRGLAAIERGLDLIEGTPIETSGTHRADRLEGRIAFEQVVVSFDPQAAPALDHIQLTIAAGESVALVGSSGAGKTTLVNLLPRFVDPTQRQIRIDGVEVRDWDLAQLRRHIAMVSQNVIVLNATLSRNVALGQVIDRNRVIQ